MSTAFEREARDLARSIATYWQRQLGPRLHGVYLIGSLAHGGFSDRYSDIDMGVTTEDGLTQTEIDAMRAHARDLSPGLAPKLSLFWGDRGFTIGRFPPLDRLDYLDRPVVLAERERVTPAPPALEEIRDYLRGAPFANWANRAHEFAGALTLDAKDRKAYLRALLYPARLCFSYATGRMTSNDHAVAYLREQTPPGLDLAPIEQALQCRQAAADPDSLFELRGSLPAQVDACAALLAT